MNDKQSDSGQDTTEALRLVLFGWCRSVSHGVAKDVAGLHNANESAYWAAYWHSYTGLVSALPGAVPQAMARLQRDIEA